MKTVTILSPHLRARSWMMESLKVSKATKRPNLSYGSIWLVVHHCNVHYHDFYLVSWTPPKLSICSRMPQATSWQVTHCKMDTNLDVQKCYLYQKLHSQAPHYKATAAGYNMATTSLQMGEPVQPLT
jgi:hypothetical protein